MTTIDLTDFHQKTVFIFDASEGMILADDVILPNGHLFASKGTVLNMELISKIADQHILEIKVFDIPDDLLQISDENITYYEKIKQSQSFTEFKTKYLSNVSFLKDNLNNLVVNEKAIDVQEIVSSTSTILAEYTNNLQIFDMLHCMRDFDDSTYIHSVNVALIASILGKWLKLSDHDIETLTICGLLHDIGKLDIPPEILTKPGRLTDNEFTIMKSHVNLGFNILQSEDISHAIKEACLLHHEKCDGSGYPFGITSEKIPDLTKIITIADIYDAMTANRVYRDAICPFEVIRLMEEDAFSKFDPRFLLPFLNNVVSSYINNTVKLSDGRIGTVILINQHAFSRPVVRCGDDFIDLSKTKDISINAII